MKVHVGLNGNYFYTRTVRTFLNNCNMLYIECLPLETVLKKYGDNIEERG